MSDDPSATATAAAQEGGPVALEVFCSRCADTAEPIAVVRRSSAGLVFDGQGQGSVDPGAELGESLRKLLGGEVPFFAPLRVVALLERPPDPRTDWPPRAVCATHGIDVFEAEQLVGAVEAAAAAGAAGGQPGRFRNGPKKVGHQ